MDTPQNPATTSPSGKPVTSGIAVIPYIDIREGSPVDLAKTHKDKTVRLIAAIRNSKGAVARALGRIVMPLRDLISKRWLARNENPYRHEIDACAAVIGGGIHSLNLSQEWACTTGAFEQQDKTVMLARVLDWPFPNLGENIVVAHQKGVAGDFLNVTWPGLSGIFSAVAKGRFAGSINQAPMRRHSRSNEFTDRWRNRFKAKKQKGLPPSHLLRKVFEEAETFEAAKQMLCTAPLSIPAIYTLSGLKPNEGCVIERTETSCVVREMMDGRVTATNHFETSLNGGKNSWRPRREGSTVRAECAKTMAVPTMQGDFEWFTAPIANALSRLVMSANATTGELKVMGTDGAKPVTQVFTI